jgi:hypothetical protein
VVARGVAVLGVAVLGVVAHGVVVLGVAAHGVAVRGVVAHGAAVPGVAARGAVVPGVETVSGLSAAGSGESFAADSDHPGALTRLFDEQRGGELQVTPYRLDEPGGVDAVHDPMIEG